MNNQLQFGRRDEPSLLDGDVEFLGVEERTVFSAPGYVRRATNTRFRTRRAATRDGITILPWGKGTGLTPFTEVYGGFVYADPNTFKEYIVIAADGGVWVTSPNQPAKSVPLPAGVTLTRATFKKFIQANAGVIMLRGFSTTGTELLPLQLTDFTTGFQVIQQQNVWDATLQANTNRVLFPAHNLLAGDPVQFNPQPGENFPPALTAGQTYFVADIPNDDEFTINAQWNVSTTDELEYAVTVTVLDGAYPIPEAVDGIFAQNRLFLIDGKDTVAVSDIGDFTRYVPTQNEFRINQGDAYQLRFLYLFNESTLLNFKTGLVNKVAGVTGDLSQAQGPLNVTQAYGITAPSVADIGTDVFWLSSELRITSLGLTELNKEQGTDQALSDPLLETFRRINPGHAQRARLAVYDGYLHVALPMDDAQLLADASANLVTVQYPNGTLYGGAGRTVTTVAGQKYQYRQSGNDNGFTNGTETVYGDADFIAAGTTVTLLGAQDADVTATVIPVLAEGVNNAVAVYDFLNKAWCGTDEAAGVVCVVDWLKFTYNGKQQLAFIGADGLLHLYADGYEDEKILPLEYSYTDVLVDSPTGVPSGATIELVTGGPRLIATANDASFDNFYLDPNSDPLIYTWGTYTGGSLFSSNPAAALWERGASIPPVDNGDGTFTVYGGGYKPGTDYTWFNDPAPVKLPEQIADGVRFFGSRNAPPQIKINGTLVANGKFAWAFLDTHSGSEIQPVNISMSVLTRAYPTQASRLESRRYTEAAVQLATWAPNYSLAAVAAGATDQTAALENVTANYLAYSQPFGKADWAPSNAADDFHTPHREDYAYPETGAGILLGTGVNFDQLQEAVDRVAINEHTLYTQLQITNTAGRLELMAIQLDTQTNDTLTGRNQ